MDNLEDIVRKLTDKLQANHLKMATAESCTGGLIAAWLTAFSGSSIWFDRGFVTYSNLSKQELLAVDWKLIETHGAVSKAVAEAMATGALTHSDADFALAVTGIAGPGGGSAEKPVGTVWFAWAKKGNPVHSLHGYFQNASRQEVRELSCTRALSGAIEYLDQFP